MKHFVFLAMALGFAPMASAAATCADYQAFIDAAGNRFADWRGREVGPGLFSAKKVFPGHRFNTRDCTIMAIGDTALVCERIAIGKDSNRFDVLLAEVTACFPKTAIVPWVEVANAPAKVIRASRLIISTPKGEVTVGVGHFQVPATRNPTSMVDHVTVGFLVKGKPPVS